MNLRFPSAEFDGTVASVCHGTATEEQAVALNSLLLSDAAARDEYLLRVALHARLASDPDLFVPEVPATDPALAALPLDRDGFRKTHRTTRLALAAGLVLLLGLAGWWGLALATARRGPGRAVALLNRTVNARWNPSDPVPRLGAPLEPRLLRLESGLAQVVFQNGARVVLEGPAELRLVSEAEAVCTSGRLTAEVPPQARGFRVIAPHLDVTDLGTAFGMNVAGGRSEVHVFQGRVQYRPEPSTPGTDLEEGNAAVVEDGAPPRLVPSDRSGFEPLFDLQALSTAAEARRYDAWRLAARRLDQDRSLRVHLDFEHASPNDWRLPNVASGNAEVPFATIVGAHWQEGRWSTKPALAFRGVGDRVRFALPGSIGSVTLAAWVRVQALDREINSLFMSDGFEPGTLHWVLRDDGVLGLTVIGPGRDHQILASPPVLTPDRLGSWIHLAVVVDGPGRRAVHYVDGRPVSRHPLRIAPPYSVGTAELGNWNAVGFPGSDPFLVRNLHGLMDEFCLFDRPLGPEEIRSLHADGHPQPESSDLR